jgi:predicted nucleotidyltransferase component of viral defense system
MIPQPAIVEWGRTASWPSDDQIEQDLLLSRLIVEIANDEYLGDELAFRGGTCLHKLRLSTPRRYSEDLDYVRRSSGGIRALFQRSKGRDLFDLWLALTVLNVDPAEMLACFQPYRPDGITAARAEQNLRSKLADANFRADLLPLVTKWPIDYDIDEAGELVIDTLLSKL